MPGGFIMSELPWLAAALLLGYVFGSIPFGLIFTRLAGLGDIRSIGSGNIGATNVLRTGHRWLAAATLIADAGKGVAAILVADKIFPGAALNVEAAAALGAFLGHIFPVWLRFKGGKGVATFLGILFALFWPMGFLFAVTWLTVALFSRYSSLAALVAAAVTPFYLMWLGRWEYCGIVTVLAVLIFITHRDNIMRLLQGKESRIGDKKPAK
jgi:glycerol-3-phosphate acyltransferase PlsY